MKQLIRNYPILFYILFAYAFSWSIEMIAIAGMHGNYKIEVLFPYLLLAQFGPTVAALAVVGLTEGKAGLAGLLRRVIIFRFPLKSYLVSIFTIPAVMCLIYLAMQIGVLPGLPSYLVYLTVMVAPLNGLVGSIVGGAGPIGEELGWRGFMLPRLLKNHNDAVASLLLGITWTFWHLPIFIFPEWRDGVSLPLFSLLYPVSVILFAYFMTKVWHMTRGSVFMAIWVHGIINFVFSYMVNRKTWDLEGFTPLQVQLILLAGMVLCCLVVHLFAAFRRKKPELVAEVQD